MEPILVPATPTEAFNKHRRISDLVKKQVEHFQHIEERLSSDVRASLPQLPQLDDVTENEAAGYISAMTSHLLSRPKQAAKKTVAIKPPAPIRPAQPLALAAAAAPTGKKAPAGKKAPTGKKSATKKKSASKKETSGAKKTLSTKTATRTKAKKSSSKRKR
jgi:hypothetical protein